MNRGQKFMQELASERINYGGVCCTRKQAYDHALWATNSWKVADMFAFGTQARTITTEEADALIPFDSAKSILYEEAK